MVVNCLRTSREPVITRALGFLVCFTTPIMKGLFLFIGGIFMIKLLLALIFISLYVWATVDEYSTTKRESEEFLLNKN